VETDRIQQEYRRRDQDAGLAARYEPADPAARFSAARRDQAISDALRQELSVSMRAARLLDVGCGAGADLVRFHALGMYPSAVIGFDLVGERLAAARSSGGRSGLTRGNSGELPFRDAAFDVVFQSMMFTSILEARLRRATASEMLRVLKPDGLILWYDFWCNPFNRATRGIGVRGLRRLFPGCAVRARRLTLASPIARLVVPFAPIAARGLEAFWCLRTHYCAVIRRASAVPLQHRS
jgi:ubiquinone/menaquinone biosynthesis C-methylase UbiE